MDKVFLRPTSFASELSFSSSLDLKIKEQGMMIRSRRHKKYIKVTHPNFRTIKPAKGAITNCPKDCPAFTSPKANPTFLGSINLLTEARTTGSPAIPIPSEEIIPSEIERVIGFEDNGIRRHPIIVIKTPSIRVFPMPYLSASIPEKGATTPVTS